MDSHIAHLFGKSLQKEAVDTKKLERLQKDVRTSCEEALKKYRRMIEDVESALANSKTVTPGLLADINRIVMEASANAQSFLGKARFKLAQQS